MPPLSFTPAGDVAAILDNLLDQYERRQEPHARVIRCDTEALDLPGYTSQLDPEPRQLANEQLRILECAGLVALTWLPGQTGHLLQSVILNPDRTGDAFALLERDPLAARRARLRDLLLGDRFRLDGWRLRAVNRTLAQLKEDRSPAPFSLTDEDHNRDLLAALVALDDVSEETPFRVFSVRVYNDSKRFEVLRGSVVRLARWHQPDWRELRSHEVLRELGLVANPGHLYLHGPWRLVDSRGVVHDLANFEPSVGIPARLAAGIQKVTVGANRVVCVENLTPFYELIRHEGKGMAVLYLGGNPSPACRHLLRCLAEAISQDASLLFWADLDYGGLSILAQLRRLVSPRFVPYRMDAQTLDAHSLWAKPLTQGDERRLVRLARHPDLADLRSLIQHMLDRGLKLEQEAVVLVKGS
ncbi:Wadjet anti-phage system protein JetD domain-containing protein [Chloroflexota bacterium]